MIRRDGHIRVLPLHVANKIAAGEVVERPASVVKELVENAIDAGAKSIRISVTQGGRKLVAVQDDGCGMTRDDAVLSLERQATSKILDVNDIERIDTLGFRGEAIPSIASVSRFTLTTRRHESDEGTLVQVNAGQLAEVRAAGCPPGTLVEVRDLFCNVPARRKFLRAYVTEENHIKQIFTVHALAHPAIGFSLTVDGRELYRLAPSGALSERILDIFGRDFVADLLPAEGAAGAVRVRGFVERPNLNQPTRRDQYVFINGRPATAPSIAYALREAYPHRPGDVRPAAILFIEMPPEQVDVNVHPTKREVRFRDNASVKQAIAAAIESAILPPAPPRRQPLPAQAAAAAPSPVDVPSSTSPASSHSSSPPPSSPPPAPSPAPAPSVPAPAAPAHLPPPPAPAPVQIEFAVDPDSPATRPWQWFKVLAITSSNYLLLETDAGLVTLNPRAARERIAYEKCLDAIPRAPDHPTSLAQALLIPEIVHLAPAEFARIKGVAEIIRAMGFALEEFGKDTFKIDAVPQLLGGLAPG
ncbi:MAG: DNA mismatch repair endonuclease MutL, partial [Kiritimatiellae bacterium]|nr:DNA mismatch repair endonuclease MutL [Kiritimatiellia bacterium]